jgi:hypothetical protein
MNQVEQWLSLLQRKRLKIVDFADKKVLAERFATFIAEWNTTAHPFAWSEKSIAKVLAKCQTHNSNNIAQTDLATAA